MTDTLVWATTALPDATVGEAYEAGLAVTGNTTAWTTCSKTTGALPAGIICNTTDKCRLTGTPTTPGLYTFTITMANSGGTGTQVSGTLTLRVRPAGGACGPDRLFSSLSALAQEESTWPTHA